MITFLKLFSHIKSPADSKHGFTLVEMLMVIAIVFVMTGISMANYNRFGREIELENAAYELALTIRQAQFYGINRSEEFGGSTYDDPQPYGVYFNLSATEPGVSDGTFLMFVDQNNDRFFEEGDSGGSGCVANPSNECVNVFSFSRSNFVNQICVGADEDSCTEISELNRSRLHITFKRPDPDATIRLDDIGTDYSYAKITLRAPAAGIPDKSVSVGAAGLISID